MSSHAIRGAFIKSALLLLLGTPALAQTAPPPGDTGARAGNEIGTGASLPRSNRASNIGGADSRTVIAPNLPSPDLGPNAGPGDYLHAARAALATGHTGEAQQALEMAETRALDRSVPLFQTNTPSTTPLVTRISAALTALGAHDRAATMQAIDDAIAQAGAS